MATMIARYPPWQINETAQGMYFYNERTQQSTWQPPTELENTIEVQRWYAQRGYQLPKTGSLHPTLTMPRSLGPAPSLASSSYGGSSIAFVPQTMPDVPAHIQAQGHGSGCCPKFFNLASAYSFYQEHHQNGVNVFIHVVCVPAILFASIVMLQTSRALFPMNAGTWLCVGYAVYYVILDLKLGLVMALVMAAMAFGANMFRWIVSESLWLSALIFIGAWVLQLIGHFVFERNRPAFCTSFLEAFMIAPLFVLIDLLRCFGVVMVPGTPARKPGLAQHV
jgi:uncharacterized membrane protein YGL010W